MCPGRHGVEEIFDTSLQSFPKTSGSKGLQIYVPLNIATSYESTKPFAHALARLLEDQHRDLVVSDMKKELRKGKVLVDWSQNDQHKTTIAIYSLRAREHPTVSTPVKWEEVEQLLKKKDPTLLVFEAEQVIKRVEKLGDLFEAVLELKQTLPKFPGMQQGMPKVETGLEISAQAASRRPSRKAVKPARRNRASEKDPQDISATARFRTRHGATLRRHFRMGVSELEADFIPPSFRRRNSLRHYATQLNTVEVNFTFRQLVKGDDHTKWIAETPDCSLWHQRRTRSLPTSNGSRDSRFCPSLS